MLDHNVCIKFLFLHMIKRNFKYNKKEKIVPDVINVGGGFPSIYPDLKPEPLENYFNEIKLGLNHLKLEKLPDNNL